MNSALDRGSAAPSAAPSATPAGAPGGVTRALDTQGGTIIARCQGGQASLLSWSPAQGYDSENIRPGPAPAATLTFEAQHTEIEIRVDRVGGLPTAHTTSRADTDQDQD